MPACLVKAVMLLSLMVPASPDRPRTVLEYAQPNVPYVNVAVARTALGEPDVERWARLLNASEAQTQMMLSLHAEFVQRHNSLLDREAPKLLAASAETRQAQMNFQGGHSEALQSLNRHASRLRQQLEEVEQAYISSLEPILTAQQAQLLPALRNEAVRRQSRSRRTVLPWAHVDIRSIWNDTDQALVSLDHAEQVDEILWTHEAALTPVLRRQTNAFWDSPVEISHLLDASRSGVMSDEEFQRRYDRVVSSYLRPLRSVRDMNERAVHLIAAALPEDAAEDFMSRARLAAFPRMYPDPHAAHHIFVAVIDDVELEPELRDLAAQLLEEYRHEYERSNRELERFYIEWGEQNALNRQGYQTQFLPDALRPMLENRERLSQQAVQRLSDAVGEDVLERHQSDDESPDGEPEAKTAGR